MTDPLESITQLLHDGRDGKVEAWDRIYALLYADLRRIARSQLHRQSNADLSPTSLVSETWLRLARNDIDVSSRAHLTSLFARAMRFVLVDEARRRLTDKRGDGVVPLPLEAGLEVGIDQPLEQLLALGQALETLSKVDPRLVKVVELRYFGGLNDTEVATVLGVTSRTVRRDWRKAQAFLVRQFGNMDGVKELGR